MDNPNCISNYYKYIIYIKDENIPVTTLKGNLKKRGIALGEKFMQPLAIYSQFIRIFIMV